MYQRNALEKLMLWAQKAGRKPLVIRGARQVGKTSLINIFGRQFEQYLYLNLELPADRQPFEEFTNVQTLVQTLFLQKNLPYSKKGRTLVFIDEIQELPAALQLLRYFYEQEPDIHVVAAGSLLESLFDGNISFPVGRVEYLVLRPVSFGEFLSATGQTAALEQWQRLPMEDFAVDRLMTLFHTYALIGGMPEVVQQYAESRDVTSLRGIYNSLITSYADDVEKYAHSQAQAQHIRHVMQVIYAEAGRRIKFEGFGKSNYGSREMGEALRTLEKAMLLHLVYPQTGATLPLLPDKKKSPRLQVLDTGLMNFVLGIQKDIIGTKDLNDVYKGILVEHLAGQELAAHRYETLDVPHFWTREKKTSTAEVDYLLPYNGRLVPLEVKSGAEGTLRSLHLFMDMAPHNMAVRLYAGKISISTITTLAGTVYYLLNLPYCLAGRVWDYLPWLEAEILKRN